jgi:uncharacterized repeat protein (TIGR03803 family)
VTKAPQQGISQTRLGAASVALTLMVVLGLGVVTAQSAPAQTLTVLYNFTGSSDGGDPYAGVVRDTAGNLYGTTYYAGFYGYGVVFKLDTKGAETVLYTFTGGPDGGYPIGGVVRNTAGTLYGTTSFGGSSSEGTVFKVSKTGKETVLHSFAGWPTDGCYPYGGLLRDKAGNLYGTTAQCGSSNNGTVFKVSKTGKETVLHNFAGGTTDGATPMFTSVRMDKRGNLYGVTEDGGNHGGGVVYKLSKRGALTVLHSFPWGTTKDGCYAVGTLAIGDQGNLYGITNSCGSFDLGIVWKVSKKGSESVLHNFAGGSADGSVPMAGVIMDAGGNLYGDTETGGASGLGAVYKVNKKGTLTLLHSFAGSDGASPIGDVILDGKGNLYGTAYAGGSAGNGTVWKLSMR